MNTAIYLRTSTEEQNPENQLKECESINSFGDYILFIDKQSAWKDLKEREQFNELKIEIKNKRIQDLIVWDWDRIFRNRKRLKEFFLFCKTYNCKIHSFRQQWYEKLNDIQEPFNEIMQELLLNMLGWLAEDESTRKSQRVKSAVRKDGNKTISYKGNKWGRKAISTQKLNQLRTIYAPNKTIRELAKELNISKSVVHKYIKIIKQENLKNK